MFWYGSLSVLLIPPDLESLHPVALLNVGSQASVLIVR